MNPFEIVLSVIPTLTTAQKKQVADLLRLDPCSTQGHKFKKVTETSSFFGDSFVISICSSCGKEIKTKKE